MPTEETTASAPAEDITSKIIKLDSLPIQKKVFVPVVLAVQSAEDAGIAKNGKPFIKLTVMDGSQFVTGTAFDCTCEQLEAISVHEGSVISTSVEVTDFNTRSYNFSAIKLVSNDPAVLNKLVPMPPYPIESMYDSIIKGLDASRESRIKKYGKSTGIAEFTKAFIEKYSDQFKTSSAAIRNHHNLKGGLIYHSYRMMQAAFQLSKVYQILDPELLTCAAAIHDIGKIRSLKTDIFGGSETTVEGLLFDHLMIGVQMLDEFRAEFEGELSDESFMLLKHLIASHHGKMEFGAIRKPAVPEALALAMIDDFDAKIYLFDKEFETTEPGGMTGYIRNLETWTYRTTGE